MRKLGLGLEFLEPLNLIPFTREGAMQELKREFDWQYYGGKHHESVFTKFYQSHILPVKFNIDKRRAHISSLICSNQISRDEGLKEISKSLYENKIDEENDLNFFLNKFDLSKSEFEKGGFEIWGLYSDEKYRIHLDQHGAVEHVTIDESGFFV